MPRFPSPSNRDNADHRQALKDFVAKIAQDPQREQVASEIEVIQSIYGDDAVRLWIPPNGSGSLDLGTIRYEVSLSLTPPHDDIMIKTLVSLPLTYPAKSPPQLQLLSRYIGPFGADSNLFGSILRTYISVTGVEWLADSVCVFDGLQNALERCTAWYEERLHAEKIGEVDREDAKGYSEALVSEPVHDHEPEQEIATIASMPIGIHLHVAEPIVDRKSSFVGRACRIFSPAEVPLILSHLMADRRISRAAHPIINAWRCQVGNLLHQDNNDDGETAAGGRLAHLLQVLEVNNVLVVVTRYFGGIHLGPDRFKHINQAARNALELGGFLEGENKKNITKIRKHR